MSVIIYAKRFKCDSCLVQAEVDEPLMMPIGWNGVRNLQVGDRCYNVDLCGICVALPFGEVMEHLEASFGP